MEKVIVIHMRDVKRCDALGYRVFRVDRQSPVGNPFYMADESQRDLVCERYDAWFKQVLACEGHEAFKAYLKKIKSAAQTKPIALACWCAPKRCHAQTIRNWLLSQK